MTLLIYKERGSPFCSSEQEPSSKLLCLQLWGAVWMVAVLCQAGFAMLLRWCLVLPCLLLCSTFLILFLLSWAYGSVQRTTLPTDALHINLACHFALRQSRMWLCTGAVILLDSLMELICFLYLSRETSGCFTYRFQQCLTRLVIVRQITFFSLGLVVQHLSTVDFYSGSNIPSLF